MISNLETKSSRELKENLFNIYKTNVNELEEITQGAKEHIVETVHLTRKRLKFLRAFVKLTRHCEHAESYKTINYLLRDSGRIISDCRDAHVRAILLEELSGSEHSSLLYQELKQMNRLSTTELENELFADGSAFQQILDTISGNEMVEYFKTIETDKECLYQGISLGYKKSYHVFHSELKSHEAELLHEWRKRSKDLLYQLEVLKDSLPQQLDPFYEELSNLCELLGRINDLFMFSEWLTTLKNSSRSLDSLSSLQKKLKADIKELTGRVEETGFQVYENTPEQFYELMRTS